MALFEYLKEVQRYAREQKQEFMNVDDLISHINKARREISLRTQCVRILTPSAGVIIGYTVVNGGSGYSNNPTIVVSPPDFPNGMLPYPNGSQATTSVIVQSGVITNV